MNMAYLLIIIMNGQAAVIEENSALNCKATLAYVQEQFKQLPPEYPRAAACFPKITGEKDKEI